MKQPRPFSGMRKFLILWAGQSLSSLGTSMTNFALIIWAYQQKGTASSVAFLSVFSYLPSILFCFVAGTLADRWNKKRIMLCSDLVAALGTVAIFILHSTGRLRVEYLYGINFILSLMNAFQNPASYVAVSLITPKEHYVRANGLFSLSNSMMTILTPALATAVLSFAGMHAILIIDLLTFAVAFCSLLFFIKLPVIPIEPGAVKEGFVRSCLAGLRFLRKHGPLLRIILFFSFVNLLASMGGNGMISVLILARTGGNQAALGWVTSAIGAGTLAGSVLVTFAKPAKRRTTVIFLACALSFLLCDTLWALGQTLPVWIFAAFAGNLPLPFLSGNMTAIMRTHVPIHMQGRVFSARDTLQFSTIPLGYFLGGVCADHLLEPLMHTASPLQQLLSPLVGTGAGSGVAVIFLFSGAIGCAASLLAWKDPRYKPLDADGVTC